MTDRWYFKHAGQIFGPVSVSQLLQLVSQGKLLAADLVWPEGTPASQGIPAEAALPFPPRLVPAPDRPQPMPAQDWIKDLRAQAESSRPQSNKKVPDWLTDVEKAEADAAVPLAQVVEEPAPSRPVVAQPVPPGALPANIPLAQVVPAAAQNTAPPLAQPVSAPAPPLTSSKPTAILKESRPPRAEGPCRFTIGSASTCGLVREKNEDSLLVQHWTWGHLNQRHELALLVVADGMGGPGSGEKASAMVVRSLAGLLTPLLLELLQGAGPPATVQGLGDRLIKALCETNRILFEVAKEPSTKGMGSTAVVALLWQNNALLSHVGDCRLYHQHAGTLTQVTRDHTMVARMVELGQLTPRQAADHPRKNEVDQAIGPRKLIDPSRHVLWLEPGDWLVLCCDGLYAHVTDHALQAAITQASSPPLLASQLIEKANQGGGSDNCTVIAAQCS